MFVVGGGGGMGDASCAPHHTGEGLGWYSSLHRRVRVRRALWAAAAATQVVMGVAVMITCTVQVLDSMRHEHVLVQTVHKVRWRRCKLDPQI